MSQEEALLAGYKMPETTQKQPQEGERTFQKRSPAIKVSINEILTGKFVRKEGLNLNYVETAYGEQISRANLISSVLVKDATPDGASVFVDDGTGKILLRSFERPDIFDKVNVGDVVTVIGKPREFNNEFYIAVEIIRKLDVKWAEIRKLELQKKPKELKQDTPDVIEHEDVVDEKVKEEIKKDENQDTNKNIVDLVRDLDKGSGVEISELIIKHNLDENEIKTQIDNLLKKGDLFELRQGVLKILE